MTFSAVKHHTLGYFVTDENSENPISIEEKEAKQRNKIDWNRIDSIYGGSKIPISGIQPVDFQKENRSSIYKNGVLPCNYLKGENKIKKYTDENIIIARAQRIEQLILPLLMPDYYEPITSEVEFCKDGKMLILHLGEMNNSFIFKPNNDSIDNDLTESEYNGVRAEYAIKGGNLTGTYVFGKQELYKVTDNHYHDQEFNLHVISTKQVDDLDYEIKANTQSKSDYLNGLNNSKIKKLSIYIKTFFLAGTKNILHLTLQEENGKHYIKEATEISINDDEELLSSFYEILSKIYRIVMDSTISEGSIETGNNCSGFEGNYLKLYDCNKKLLGTKRNLCAKLEWQRHSSLFVPRISSKTIKMETDGQRDPQHHTPIEQDAVVSDLGSDEQMDFENDSMVPDLGSDEQMDYDEDSDSSRGLLSLRKKNKKMSSKQSSRNIPTYLEHIPRHNNLCSQKKSRRTFINEWPPLPP